VDQAARRQQRGSPFRGDRGQPAEDRTYQPVGEPNGRDGQVHLALAGWHGGHRLNPGLRPDIRADVYAVHFAACVLTSARSLAGLPPGPQITGIGRPPT
jgi:hypothetical protein